MLPTDDPYPDNQPFIGDPVPVTPTAPNVLPLYPTPGYFRPPAPAEPKGEIMPYRCPVCNAHGTVPAGFYDHLENLPGYEQCRACKGTGIVWRTYGA